MTNRPLQALSIKQPWADLILFKGKDIENRTWPLPETMKGRRIFVHAGKKPDLAAPLRFCGALATNPEQRTGAILGEVTIVDCVTKSDSEWFEGPYGFALADPVAYDTPIPCRGMLGFFFMKARDDVHESFSNPRSDPMTPSEELHLLFDQYGKEEIRRALGKAREDAKNARAVDAFLALVVEKLRSRA